MYNPKLVQKLKQDDEEIGENSIRFVKIQGYKILRIHRKDRK